MLNTFCTPSVSSAPDRCHSALDAARAFTVPYPGALSVFASLTTTLSASVVSNTNVANELFSVALAWKACRGMPGIRFPA